MTTPVAIRDPHRWEPLEFEDDTQRACVCNSCGWWRQQFETPKDDESSGAPCLFCGAKSDHHPWCERPRWNGGERGHHAPDCPTLYALIGYDPMAGGK